ncbi:MAG: aminotransferase class IV [Actinomycetes bacterium]
MTTPSAPGPRVPRPIAWVDGRIVPADQATVPLLDDGVLRGDAVFDAMLVRRGRTHAADAHLARLRASAKALGIRVPVVRQAMTDLLAAWGEHDGAMKLIVTRSGTLRGLVQAVQWPASISLAVVDVPWRTAISGVKTLSYAANQWAQRQAQAAHADDALVATDGTVMELPTGALVVVRDGVLATPDPRLHPILDSVTVHELALVEPVERTILTVDDVRGADEVFVVSATRPVLPVHAIDDVELPAPGPVTADVAARFREHVDATLDPLP